MMMSDDKVGGWVKKGQNHDDVILEWSLIKIQKRYEIRSMQCSDDSSSSVPICSGGPDDATDLSNSER